MVVQLRVTDHKTGKNRTTQNLRAERPGADFTISMRTHWNGKDLGELRDRLAAYAAVGVQHVLIAPVNREVDDWDAVIEGAGQLVGR